MLGLPTVPAYMKTKGQDGCWLSTWMTITYFMSKFDTESDSLINGLQLSRWAVHTPPCITAKAPTLLFR
jgi:hypothetical protein